jgi:hypothetical protein
LANYAFVEYLTEDGRTRPEYIADFPVRQNRFVSICCAAVGLIIVKNVKIFVVSNLLNFSLHMNKTTILVSGCVMTTDVISSKGDIHLQLRLNQTNQIVLSRVTTVII